jgi:type II secretion system protein H
MVAIGTKVASLPGMNLSRRRPDAGITLVELLMVVVILGILTAFATPKIYQKVNRTKVDQAAGVIAQDLEQAVSLAARRRKPVQLSRVNSTSYSVRDRASSPNDSLRLYRSVARTGDQGVSSIEFSRNPVQIFPDGTTDGALTVTLNGAGLSRTVTLSAAGQVRIN